MGLIIRSSSIHAAGCYTTASISQGTRVVEYTGPIISKEEGDRRYDGRPITYLFGIGDGSMVIDGHGMAMFINHSCAANCETEEIDGHIWITAIRDIAVGEELCYDYCLYDGDEDEAPCNCGATSCRGSMFSDEELEQRERVLKKKPVTTKQKKPRRKKSPLKKTRKPGNTPRNPSASNKKAISGGKGKSTAAPQRKAVSRRKNISAKAPRKTRRG
jgi:hypothetical protein